MNNRIYCQCIDCGNEFSVPVHSLLDEDQATSIGELVWCGNCDSHRYECSWGIFPAGSSSDTVADVLRLWSNWAKSHRASQACALRDKLR